MAISMPTDVPPAKVLVLHDGGVLVGKVSRLDDYYVVSTEGGEIHVPAASVLITCARLEDAYEHRRTLIMQPTAEAHLTLAAWCIRYGLFPQAARELVDARGLDPRNSRIALLERRLTSASEPRLHDRREPVVQARHDRPAPVNQPASTLDPALVNELPNGAIERFTRRVQPILVNNCTTSGCHQPGGQQEFQLDRALLHGLANRRSTRRNLAATLALVDRTQPQLSPLLSVSRRAHGGMSSPIFGPRQQAAFTHLVDWVTLLTAPEPPEAESAPVAANATATLSEAVLPAQAMPSVGTDLETDTMQAIYLDENELTALDDRPVQYGAQLQAWQPKDEFDPEIFNRWQRSRAQRRQNALDSAPIENR